MNCNYKDILERIDEPPKWWDENAVPRFCDFSPDDCADIYSTEVALLLITCQGCGIEMNVCVSRSSFTRFTFALRGVEQKPSLQELVEDKVIHYGDPPAHGCVGDTMNSEPRKVLEFWLSDFKHIHEDRWKRQRKLEINVEPAWVSPKG